MNHRPDRETRRRHVFHRGSLACALLVLSVAGCATVQTTKGGAVGIQRKQYIAGGVSEELAGASKATYGKMLAEARARKALNVDRKTSQRVRSISERLVAQVGNFRPDAEEWDWEVNVFADDDVNAACMEGGRILVFSGLVDKLDPTDDELAAVLGHEISHALRQHVAETVSTRRRNQSVTSIFSTLASVALSVTTGVEAGDTLESVSQFGTEVFLSLPHDREQEREADRMGLELAARSGYDPRAAVGLWRKMEKVGGGQGGFLSTHPSGTERIVEIEETIPDVLPLYEDARRKRR